MQVVVNDLITSYSISGTGPVVLCLHGWGDRKETYKRLTREIPSMSVVALDLPGFGSTQAPPAAWTLDDYSKFVSSFVDKLGINVNYVIGHSNGGAIAIKLVSTKVVNPEKLVLLATSGIRDAKTPKKLSLKIMAKLAKKPLELLKPEHQWRIKKKLYSVVGSDAVAVPHMRETFNNIVSEDVRNNASSIEIKTLLIYGDNDTATPPRYGEQYREIIKDSELIIVPNAGHFVHHDQPEAVSSAIRGFLQ